MRKPCLSQIQIFLEEDTSGEVKENSNCNPGFCVLPLKTCHILKWEFDYVCHGLKRENEDVG